MFTCKIWSTVLFFHSFSLHKGIWLSKKFNLFFFPFILFWYSMLHMIVDIFDEWKTDYLPCKNVQKSAFYTWIANFSLPDWAHFTMLIIVSKINCLKPSFLFTADKQKKPIHWVFHHFSAKNRTHILNKKWNISCIVELWYLFIWF